MLSRNQFLHNRYRIIRPLGKGGFGQVYEAIDDKLDCIVAIKERHAKLTDEKMRRAFEREAKLLANLRHPVLPKVSDHFFAGEGQFLVMEFVEGDDLAVRLAKRERPFSIEQVLTWAEQLLRALQYLHSRPEPIFHRDLKPANIKLTDEGEIFLLDFGIAKGYAGEMSVPGTSQRSSSVHGYTAAYAPLEQLNNSGTNQQSDIYSLGATLYHLLTDKVPATSSERYTRSELGQDDPLRAAHEINPDVPTPISLVLSQSMAMSRRDRIKSAAEMRQALALARREIKAGNKEIDTNPQPFEFPSSVNSQVEDPIHEGPDGPLATGPTVPSPTAPSPVQPHQSTQPVDLKNLIIHLGSAPQNEEAAQMQRQIEDIAPPPSGRQVSWPSVVNSETGDSQWNSTVMDSQTEEADDRTASQIQDERTKDAPDSETVEREKLEKLKRIEEESATREAEERRRNEELEAARRAAEEERSRLEREERERREAEELEAERRRAAALAESEARRREEKQREEERQQREKAQQKALKEQAKERNVSAVSVRPGTDEEKTRDAIPSTVAAVTQPAGIPAENRKSKDAGDQSTLVVGTEIYRPAPETDSKQPEPETNRKWVYAGIITLIVGVVIALLAIGLRDTGKVSTGNVNTQTPTPTPPLSVAHEYSLIHTLKQPSKVWSVALSPDASLAASGGEDNIVTIWNARTWEKKFSLKEHNGIVNSVAFSPDGRMLVSGSSDHTMILWDTLNRSRIKTFNEHRDKVLFVAFSPDGQTLASASADKTIKIWDVGSGVNTGTLTGHHDEIWAVAFSPDGRTLASGGKDQTTLLWDLGTMSVKRPIKTGKINFLTFSPADDALATAHSDGTVKLWEPATGKLLRTLEGHKGYVSSITFTRDGNTIASSSKDQNIIIHDAKTGKQKQTLSGHQGSVESVCFSWDGRTLISGGRDHVLLVWQ